MLGFSNFGVPAVVLAVACLVGCGDFTNPGGKAVVTVPGDGVTVMRNLIYTPPGWPEKVPGDLYRPGLQAGLSPAVLLIHGGGWTGGDGRWQMEPIARHLAKRGYVVLNVTYRLAPEYTFPAPVEDMQEALKWMRRHAGEYGIDAGRMAAFGYSAGGYLADFAGLTGPESKWVKAIVAGGAPTDLTYYAGGDLVPQFVGGSLQEMPGKFHAASPVNYVTPHSPPMFLYHGTKDELVRLEHPRAMIAELQRNGVPYQTYWIEGRGHIPTFLFPADAVNRAIDFLDREIGKR